MTLQVLAFRAGDERYLVRLASVRAVVRLRGLRRLPGSTGALVGVLDVQETPVAVYDARAKPAAGSGDVLVMSAGWPEHAVGVACDGVEGLLELPEPEAQPSRMPGYVEALLRVNGEMVPLVDVLGLAAATSDGAGSDVTLEDARLGEA